MPPAVTDSQGGEAGCQEKRPAPPETMRVGLVLNAGARGASHDILSKLRRLLEARLPPHARLIEPEAVDPSDDQRAGALVERLTALARKADVLVIGGGDGTVRAAAEALRGTQCRLMIIPLGTMNVFARDLGLPADPARAAAVIANGVVRRVDVGEINGQVFLNSVMLGQFGELAEERERLRKGGWRGAAVALRRAFQTFVRARTHRYWLESRERRLSLRSRMVAVMNNALRDAPGDPFARATLTGGALEVYASRDPSVFALPKILLRMFIGRPRPDATLERWETQALLVRTRRRRVKVSVDGEVRRLRTPLRCEMRAGALPVIVPGSGAGSSTARESAAGGSKPAGHQVNAPESREHSR